MCGKFISAAGNLSIIQDQCWFDLQMCAVDIHQVCCHDLWQSGTFQFCGKGLIACPLLKVSTDTPHVVLNKAKAVVFTDSSLTLNKNVNLMCSRLIMTHKMRKIRKMNSNKNVFRTLTWGEWCDVVESWEFTDCIQLFLVWGPSVFTFLLLKM